MATLTNYSTGEEIREATAGEVLRYGSFGVIVWDLTTGETRMATQADMDDLPVGDDLTADEENEIETA